MSARVIQPGETPQGTIGRLTKRLGAPAVRAATRQAMRLMGNHFVLGETIEAALAAGAAACGRAISAIPSTCSAKARAPPRMPQRYFNSYASAIEAIGRAAGNRPLPDRPGISVKLSALHPRFEAVSRERVMTELVPRLIDLARQAKAYDLNFTVDAEEADRLELSLDVIAAVFADPSLAGWDGFGLAIQAYQKRAADVIDYVDDSRAALDRRMMVRLVKGAYWDTEIKRAQERGLDGYPVFTRKAMTDLNYIACAQQLLALRPRIFPQFATHNALTVATILELAGGERAASNSSACTAWARRCMRSSARTARTSPAAPMRRSAAIAICSPIWCGACWRTAPTRPSSRWPPTKPCRLRTLLRRPADIIGSADNARHPNIPLPRDLYRPQRKNSRGIEFGERAALEPAASRRSLREPLPAAAKRRRGDARQQANAAIAGRAATGSSGWSRTPAEHARSRTGEGRRSAGSSARRISSRCCSARAARRWTTRSRKSARPSISAATTPREGRELFGEGKAMPGPTGESNVLRLRGRGVFVAISPWNFPLAIFLGQVTAALMAGNAVVAKPAEQTPLIAAEAVRLLHEAGVPTSALHLVPGDGRIGAALVAHPDIAGVVFTGSTEVARTINRALAAKDGPIVPLIAETGGINAMIVDATALPEQVADDVVTSAFRSAGQRCSALRLLFVQDDVADRMIEMIAGAARELAIGDPARSRHAYRPGDRCRGQAAAGRAYRAHEAAKRGCILPAPRPTAISSRRIFSNCPMPDELDGRSVRPGPACGALPRRPARRRCCNRSSAPATG